MKKAGGEGGGMYAECGRPVAKGGIEGDQCSELEKEEVCMPSVAGRGQRAEQVVKSVVSYRLWSDDFKNIMNMAIRKFFILFIILAVPAAVFARGDAGNPHSYLAAYESYVRGEQFTYHSAHPGISAAILVRSMQEELYIEWSTQKVPPDYREGPATFIFLAAINVRENDSHSWDIMVNGKKRLSISTPGSRDLKDMVWKGSGGYSLRFKPVMVDRHGDLHGYCFLSVPGDGYTRGEALNIKVVGESANDRSFFIVYRHKLEPLLRVVPEQAIRKDGDKAYQLVSVNYTYLGDPLKVKISAGGKEVDAELDFGYNNLQVSLPMVKEESPFDVLITQGEEIIAAKKFILEPVVHREVHLLHHSHVDIGYTHVQDEVKRIQWEHLENAIKIAERTADYPEGARFRWNAEVMWPLETYFEEKSEAEKGRMIEAIRKGYIEPGAMFAHELSELCNTEELVQLTTSARRISERTGTDILSAMITDVPGWSWGLVPVLAGSGVKYLSLGTNHGHRIGTIKEEWGDRPFWWVSASGEEKLLTWIHEEGYALFHTGFNADKMGIEGISEKLFAYLNKLYERDYPYEIVPLRYSVGADNGPTDPSLPDMIIEWNNNFVSPQLRISTVSETFSEFESSYGHLLPVVKAAFTGYWEDGAASSARETALNRENAGNANIINSLAVLLDYDGDLQGETNELWKKILLYDEHTWGAHNSISEPESDFALSQWDVKSSFARDAAQHAARLKTEILDAGKSPGSSSTEKAGGSMTEITARGKSPGSSSTEEAGRPASVEVINTHSWPVSCLVTLPPSWLVRGTGIRDEEGRKVASQELSTGQLVFIARDLPPLGSEIFYFSDEKPGKPLVPVQDNSIENDMFILSVNGRDGSIESLYDRKRDIELVNSEGPSGLNSYFYVDGRSPEVRHGASGAKVEVIDDGELVSVIKTVSTAPGCESITNYYRLVKGIDRVYITTVADKKKIYDPEGVHLCYPFNIPGGEINIDLALAVYRAGAGQAPGACRNYFTPERWVDISGRDKGVTFITLDAPLIEIGDITTDATAVGWLDETPRSQTIYSYIMNNYWETNYRAAQQGKVSFRYVLCPHRAFNSATAEKRALEEAEPPVLVRGATGGKGRESLFTIAGSNIICTALIPAEDGYLIRLFNAGGAPEKTEISFMEEPAQIWLSDFDGTIRGTYNREDVVPPYGLRTIRVITE